MTSQASERLSAAKAGWVIVSLMAGWVLFLVLPFGREQEPAPDKAPIERPGEAKLAAVGLRYNVDWLELPGLFAVWADQAHWYQDKVKFAYWNASSRAYDYFFEAQRHGASIRFRPLSRAEAVGTKFEYAAQERLHPDPDMTEQERAEEFPAHPFVFLPLWAPSGVFPGRTEVPMPARGYPDAGPIPIDLPVVPPNVRSLPGPLQPDVPSKN